MAKWKKIYTFLIIVICICFVMKSFFEKDKITSKNTAKDEYYADSYEILNDGTDCTEKLQGLIDMVYEEGGGTIYFGKGNYAFQTINLRSNVSLKGQGVGETTLERLGESEDNTAFIFIPTYAVGFTISDLCLNGNKESDTSVTDGIVFQDGSTYNFDGDSYDFIKDPDMVISDEKERTYKFATIENIHVIDFSGNGIYIGTVNFEMTMDNFYVYNNDGKGLYNKSLGNVFTNCYIESNGGSGIVNEGENSKFENIKSIWNGRLDHSAWGIENLSSRCNYSNVEVQDNWCNGFYTLGQDNSVVNLLSDSNGYSFPSTMTPQDCNLIEIEGVRNRIIGMCSQYRRDLDPVAEYAVVMNNCKDCRVDITVEDTCAISGCILDENQCY